MAAALAPCWPLCRGQLPSPVLCLQGLTLCLAVLLHLLSPFLWPQRLLGLLQCCLLLPALLLLLLRPMPLLLPGQRRCSPPRRTWQWGWMAGRTTGPPSPLCLWASSSRALREVQGEEWGQQQEGEGWRLCRVEEAQQGLRAVKGRQSGRERGRWSRAPGWHR